MLLVRALRLRVRPAHPRNRFRLSASPANGPASLETDIRRLTDDARLRLARCGWNSQPRQGSVAPLGSKCAKFGRAPPAQELADGFGTGRPRSSRRLHNHSGQEFAGRLPCSPAPWSASDPVFSPGRPSGRLGCANNRRIRRDFKRVCEPVDARPRTWDGAGRQTAHHQSAIGVASPFFPRVGQPPLV